MFHGVCQKSDFSRFYMKENYNLKIQELHWKAVVLGILKRYK